MYFNCLYNGIKARLLWPLELWWLWWSGDVGDLVLAIWCWRSGVGDLVLVVMVLVLVLVLLVRIWYW